MKGKQKIKRVYLVHRWGATHENDWYSWLETELKKKGFEVKVLDMPDTDNPKIEGWVSYLETKIKNVDEETYFVGHSIGCQTIMRFLEKLPKSKKIAGCVFIAPWFDLINLETEELKIAHPWTSSKIDFSRVLVHCNNFLTIFSSNDPYVHIDQAEKFKKNIEAKVIIKHNKGHFTEEDGVEKIPEILEFIK